MAKAAGLAQKSLYDLADSTGSVIRAFADMTKWIAENQTRATSAAVALGAAGPIAGAVATMYGANKARQLITGGRAAAAAAGARAAGVGAATTTGTTALDAAGAAAKQTLGRSIPILGDILLGLSYGSETGSIGRGISAGLGSFGGRLGGAAAMGAAGTLVAPVLGTGAGLVAGEVAGGFGGAYAGAKAWDKISNWFSSPPPSAEDTSNIADGIDPLEQLLKDLGTKLDTLILKTTDVISNTAYASELLEQGHTQDETMHRRLVATIGNL